MNSLVPPEDFLGLEGKTHLNTAAECPMLQRSAEAVTTYMSMKSEAERGRRAHDDITASCRAQVAALFGGAAEQPDIDANNEQRRAERRKQREDRICLRLNWCRPYVNAALDPFGFKPGIDEHRQDRFEIPDFVRHRSGLAFSRRRCPLDRSLEFPVDFLSLRMDCLDIVFLQFSSKDGVGDRLRALWTR